MLPDASVLPYALLAAVGNEEGARGRFQTLVTDLVSVRYPHANEVAAPGGTDWGIDTYVGRLDLEVVVWQSKFFLDWTGEAQRSQVRSSFTHIMKMAVERRFRVSAWTLCVPGILPPSEQQWWDNWSTKQRRLHKVEMRLWNGVEFRRQLLQEDAKHVRKEFFGHLDALSGAAELDAEAIQLPDDLQVFDDALFVRQLNEAGLTETDAARGLFFAADALARDLTAKGQISKVAALNELHLEIHQIWEAEYNKAAPSADGMGRIANLVNLVMAAAEQDIDPPGLRLRPAHRKGLVHRIVEDARAGWVTHWRQVASEHADAVPVSTPKESKAGTGVQQ